jgi:tetratricopeptide (TPR) repeat protein
VTRIYRQDVLRHLKIHPSQLRAWEQKGLISRQDSYNLEECGRLRTLRDLALRFSPATISASVGAMKIVAGMENPLLEARPVAGGARVLFRHRGSVTEPIARQFVFDFEPSGATAAGTPEGQSQAIEIHRAGREARTSEMFLEAVRCEDSAQIEQATQLYERILELNPDHAPTCINLGTICYNRRQFARAEQLYRRATLSDPDYALAFFDLGNVLDELKRLPEAIAAYRTAIRLVPAYADAHYNLALAYERTGERRLALRHWTAYLRLDANSRWASHARRQIRKILDREGLAIVHRSPRLPAPRSLRRSTFATSPVKDSPVPTAG